MQEKIIHGESGATYVVEEGFMQGKGSKVLGPATVADEKTKQTEKDKPANPNKSLTAVERL